MFQQLLTCHGQWEGHRLLLGSSDGYIMYEHHCCCSPPVVSWLLGLRTILTICLHMPGNGSLVYIHKESLYIMWCGVLLCYWWAWAECSHLFVLAASQAELQGHSQTSVGPPPRGDKIWQQCVDLNLELQSIKKCFHTDFSSIDMEVWKLLGLLETKMT